MKSIAFVAWIMFQACLPLRASGQYLFSVTRVDKGPHPDVVVVYGEALASQTALDCKQVIIYRGRDTVSIIFSGYSLVLKNWVTDETNCAQQWRNIEGTESKISKTLAKLDAYTGRRDSPYYVLLQDKLKKNLLLKEELYALWNSRMIEQIKGTVTAYSSKSKLSQSFVFSSSKAGSLDPLYLQMYASGREGKLNLYFFVGTGLLPSIFREILEAEN